MDGGRWSAKGRESKQMARIFVGMPVIGGYYPQMVNSLLRLQQENPGGHHFVFKTYFNESMISRARSKLATEFLESDCEYLLFIDADLEFPADAVDRLIRHDRDIVAAPYSVKNIPARWALAFEEQPTYVAGLLKVRSVPAGFTLIKRRVFEALVGPDLVFQEEADDRSYYAFYLPYLVTREDGRRVFLSEDFAFCRRAADKGFEIHCDFDVRLNHWGTYRYHMPEIDGKLPSHPMTPVVGEFGAMTATVAGLMEQPGAGADQDYAALLQTMMSSFSEVGTMLQDLVAGKEPPAEEKP